MTSEFVELDTVIHFKGDQMNELRRYMYKLEEQLETLTRQYDELEARLLDTNIDCERERDELRRKIQELEAR
jgi:chromosome segregation ATPase